MAQTLESMRRRIESAEDLYAVVRVMKALAAASIRQCERAVESLAEYNRTIEKGLPIVLWNRREANEEESSTGQRRGIIVLGSEPGTCRSFNEQGDNFAPVPVDGPPAQDKNRKVHIIGTRGRGQT